jgi:hypothetical protein
MTKKARNRLAAGFFITGSKGLTARTEQAQQA